MNSSFLSSYYRLLLCTLLLFPIATGMAHAQQSGEDEGNRLDFGGYGSFRLDAHDGEHGAPAFTLRRFVLTSDARLGPHFQVYSEIEYERLGQIEVERSAERDAGGLAFEQELEGTAGSELSLEQAWGQYNVSEHFGVRFGAVLPPVGRFNLHHDDNLWNTAHRPLIDRAAQVLPGPAAWTEMGLGIAGTKSFDSGVLLSYQAFLLTGTTLDFALEEKVVTRVPQRNKLELEAVVRPTQGAFDGSNAADAGAARFALSPSLGSEYALSGYIGRYTPSFIDTKASMYTLGLDGRQRLGPFYLEGEFLYSRYDKVSQVIDGFAMSAVDHATETESTETAALETEIAIELGGLAARRYGFWLDLSRPIALPPVGYLEEATLTPIIRYERVWIRDAVDGLDFSGGVVTSVEQVNIEQDRLTIGLGFRPVPQVVFHLAYVRSNPIEGDLIVPSAQAASQALNAFTFGLAAGF